MKYDYIIAVDPDVDASGVATLWVAERKMETAKLPFPYLCDFLHDQQARAKRERITMCVVIEAGWVNKTNWHVTGRNARTAAAIGKQTGRNHEVGRLLVEMAKHYGCNVIEQPPLKKCWRGKDGKITADELQAFTGVMGRTNQDQRDACLLAWVTADLPIRIVKC